MAEAVDNALVVRTSVFVPLDREAAFRLFTEQMATWWPLETHSVHHADASGVVVEPHVGGRVYETTDDGRTAEWGVVGAWDPPSRLAMSWYPGHTPDLATQLEIGFEAVAAGGTTVRLVHSGFEVRGDQAVAVADEYRTGWEYVLGRLVEAA